MLVERRRVGNNCYKSDILTQKYLSLHQSKLLKRVTGFTSITFRSKKKYPLSQCVCVCMRERQRDYLPYYSVKSFITNFSIDHSSTGCLPVLRIVSLILWKRADVLFNKLLVRITCLLPGLWYPYWSVGGEPPVLDCLEEHDPIYCWTLNVYVEKWSCIVCLRLSNNYL